MKIWETGYEKKIKLVWDILAKEDLKRIYYFNKENLSIEFAKKVREAIYNQVGSIVFLEQWQEDENLGLPYRRIIIRNYKIVYLVKNNNLNYILAIFDIRQDPSKYKLQQRG